jgi:hypothetical protein
MAVQSKGDYCAPKSLTIGYLGTPMTGMPFLKKSFAMPKLPSPPTAISSRSRTNEVSTTYFGTIADFNFPCKFFMGI